MILSAQFARPDSTADVAIFIDANTMTIVPVSDLRVVEWIAAANVIAPYVPPQPSSNNVDIERDRRIGMPLTVNLASPTRSFQVNMDADALRNMSGLATAAVLAKVLNSSAPTNFIAYDNSIISLSPDDMIALGVQVQARIGKMTFAGRAIKNMIPIPADFATNENYWA